MSEDKKSGLKTVIVILLLLIVVIVTFNPMSRQQINTLATGDISYEFSEVYTIIEHNKDQYDPDMWGNIVVWSDYRALNDDIYGYNFTSDSVFVLESEIYGEWQPAIWGNNVGWNQYTTDHEAYEGIYLNNLTEWKLYDVPIVGHEESPFDVWGDEIVYTLSNKIYIHNFTTDVTTTVRHDLFDSTGYIQRYGDYIMIREYWGASDIRWYLHKITTNQTILVDSQSGSSISHNAGDINGHYYAYYLYNSGGIEINLYDMNTGRTTHIVENGTAESFTYNVNVDIWGDWVVWNQHDASAGGWKIWAYNIETEDMISSELFDTAGTRGVCVSDGIVVFANQETGSLTQYDLYYMEILEIETPTPPPPPSPEEFLVDNWWWIVTIILVISILLFVEGYYFKWEHTKRISKRLNIGLIVSAGIIIAILIYWGLYG